MIPKTVFLATEDTEMNRDSVVAAHHSSSGWRFGGKPLFLSVISVSSVAN